MLYSACNHKVCIATYFNMICSYMTNISILDMPTCWHADMHTSYIYIYITCSHTYIHNMPTCWSSITKKQNYSFFGTIFQNGWIGGEFSILRLQIKRGDYALKSCILIGWEPMRASLKRFRPGDLDGVCCNIS